jgi:predicted dehydrogenase
VSLNEAFKVIEHTRPEGRYKGAVIGCGRMGSTIDDEHVGQPSYIWPWAHAPAVIEARNIDLVAASDTEPERLVDFERRWGVNATYTDYREMVEKEKPDLVCVATRPAPRAEIVTNLAEMGVPAVFATKPMSYSLKQADTMIDACKSNGTVLAIASHFNWYGYYDRVRELIDGGEIGALRSMICHHPHTLSNMHSHTFALFRLIAGSPADWVFGHMDDEERANSNQDLSGSGYIVYRNGIRAHLNSFSDRTRNSWTIEFIGEAGKIVSRIEHSEFELWGKHPETGELIERQFPGPWHRRSSLVDAIEQICRCLESDETPLCPGEFGREALELAIGMRESHRRGNTRVDLPLEDRTLKIEAFV